MNTDVTGRRDVADQPGWINPTVESGGISQYWEAIRGAWWLIVATVIGCVGANLLILADAEKVYESSSYLVVSPVSDRDSSYAGLSILRESNEPARNLETLARSITTPAVAQGVKKKVNVKDSASKLLDNVKAVPVAQSDLLEIRAEAASPELAQQLANAFAVSTIDDRTARMHMQADVIIAGLKPLVRSPQDPAAQVVALRLAQLQALRAGPDPTVRLDTPAELKSQPVSPKPVLSTVVSLIAGLLIGVGSVLGLQVVDPRIRSERQLRELYRLPILARLPKIKRRFGLLRRAALTQDSYQPLRVALMGAGRERGLGGSVFLTGPSRRDGKTTTAVGLARTLAQSGERTTLVEADARRPAIGDVMRIPTHTGFPTHAGLLEVISGARPLSEALVHPDRESANLNVLLVEQPGDWLADLVSPTAADRLLSELEEVSDWVVIDSAPLGQVIDALPLAVLADHVLLVVRLGKSQLGELRRLTETLAQYGLRPTGFVVIGGPRSSYG